MKPTHAHTTHATRAARIGTAQGEGHLAGQQLVIYLDLSIEPPTTHYVETERWETEWRKIPADACPVCHGSGTDQIKRRQDRPCGGCYGLGRVRQDGETPQEMWELAEVAGRVIAELREERDAAVRQRMIIEAVPGVREAVEAKQAEARRQREDAQAEQERRWRDGRGHGPGGARMTGD